MRVFVIFEAFKFCSKIFKRGHWHHCNSHGSVPKEQSARTIWMQNKAVDLHQMLICPSSVRFPVKVIKFKLNITISMWTFCSGHCRFHLQKLRLSFTYITWALVIFFMLCWNKYSLWLLQVMWLVLVNSSALLKPSFDISSWLY